jgi:hypothetical protein
VRLFYFLGEIKLQDISPRQVSSHQSLFNMELNPGEVNRGMDPSGADPCCGRVADARANLVVYHHKDSVALS